VWTLTLPAGLAVLGYGGYQVYENIEQVEETLGISIGLSKPKGNENGGDRETEDPPPAQARPADATPQRTAEAEAEAKAEQAAEQAAAAPENLEGAASEVEALVALLSEKLPAHVNAPAPKMKIIGITGTLGAGKGTVVDYLMQPPHSFAHYSARSLLTEIIEERGLPLNRDSMRDVANGMRAANGPAALIEALFEKAQEVGVDAIIESVRNEGEVVALRKSGQPFLLLAVDAEQSVRYERVCGRGSETDGVTFEQFCEQEAAEMASTEPHEQNLGRCMALANARLTNDGGVAELHAQVGFTL
jgi:dephospho-CoA kinase